MQRDADRASLFIDAKLRSEAQNMKRDKRGAAEVLFAPLTRSPSVSSPSPCGHTPEQQPGRFHCPPVLPLQTSSTSLWTDPPTFSSPLSPHQPVCVQQKDRLIGFLCRTVCLASAGSGSSEPAALPTENNELTSSSAASIQLREPYLIVSNVLILLNQFISRLTNHSKSLQLDVI